MRTAETQDPVNCFPGGGDRCFPLNFANAKYVGDNVDSLHSAWCAKIGTGIIKLAATRDVPMCRSCDDEYGFGRCKDVLGTPYVKRWKECKKQLRDYCKAAVPKAGKFDEAWGPLNLIYFGPAEMPAAGSDAAPGLPGYVALIMDVEFSNFDTASALQPSRPLHINDIVEIQLALDSLIDTPKLVARYEHTRQAFPVSFAFFHIMYEQIGLLRYRVLGIESAFEMGMRLTLARREARELKYLSDLAAGKPLRLRKRKRQSAVSTSGPSHKVTKVDEVAGESAEISSSSGSSSDEPDADDLGDVPDADDLGDVPDADAHDLGDVSDADIPVAGGGEEEEDIVVAAGKPDEIRYYSNDGTYLGRTTLIRKNSPGEAMSIYCTRHQCKIMRTVAKAPSAEAVVAWMAAGLKIPKSKDASHQRRHKDLLP